MIKVYLRNFEDSVRLEIGAVPTSHFIRLADTILMAGIEGEDLTNVEGQWFIDFEADQAGYELIYTLA